MEFGPKDDFPVTNENDEIDGVGMTDLADERIIYPKSTSNSNQNVCGVVCVCVEKLIIQPNLKCLELKF